MAIIKCKMCGGDLELVPDSTVCECEYCGTRQTVPAADDEKKLKLFERANRLRRACEFDKAAGVYESIVADFDTEAEAYWGLVLCKFGIEYVDDPATGKKVPTCHRSSFESIFEDDNFEQACENADGVARRVYREEAKAIEELRKGILEVSSKEEPYDIFISYKELTDDGDRTLDSVIAQDIYSELTNKGYRVFFSRISLEDKLGTEYEPYIFAALQSAKVMLVVGTDYDHFNAVWVKNEWSRFLALMASGQKKTLIPVFKDIDAYDMPKEFSKLAAQDMGKVGAMQDLLRGVEKIIPLKTAEPTPAPAQPVVMSGGPNVTALQKRGVMALEDGEWDAAKDFFNQILNTDAENAEAWLGLAMADLQLQHESVFAALRNGQAQADGNANYRRFLRFAAPERAQQIRDMVSAAEEKKQKRDAAEAERRAAEEIRRQQEAEAQRQRERKAAAEKEARAAAEREAQRRKQEAHINELKAARERIAPAQRLIAAGAAHTVALKLDGTLYAVGGKMVNACKNVPGWKNIIAVAAGPNHTVGIRSDGTVVVGGEANGAHRNVSDWKNIIAVAAGSEHTVGLKADGTVVAVGKNRKGECDVTGWKDIIAIAAGDNHTVGLKADGTVMAVGYNGQGQCDVSDWRDIVSIAAVGLNTVGLNANGTVVAIGAKACGQCNVSSWRDIVAVDVGGSMAAFAVTIGLKADGTVVAVGDNKEGTLKVSEWRDVVAVAAGNGHTVGLKSDGTLVAVGRNDSGQSLVFGWKLFDSIDTLQEDKDAVREKHISDLQDEKQRILAELPTIKGLFAASKKEKLEARLAELEAELKALT
ncbi:MAG: TIR domain-containing protein [Oscillospiraceae bacterium]|nr:TIR domain-containing protein [Oscillospiraceae bacterium]